MQFLEAAAYFEGQPPRGHDIRGTRKILNLYADRPQLLRPFLASS